MFTLTFSRAARFANAEERRRFKRDAARLPAFIVAEGRSIPCMTANLSDGGAQLTLSIYQYVPEAVEVSVPSRNIRARARVVWRDDLSVGVQFVG